jgi:hypothetical protein
MKVSKKLKLELLKRRAAGAKQYEIAKSAKVHPTILSSLINDALPLKDDDQRVLRLAVVLGVAARHAFERETVSRG